MGQANLSGSDSGSAGLDGSRPWRRIEDDGKYSECLYRLTGNGQVEVLALGAHVVVPFKALPLLPEPIARAVLTELAERAAAELRRVASTPPAEQEP